MVRHQHDVGADVVSDGEESKSISRGFATVATSTGGGSASRTPARSVSRAVILAAGTGARLQPLTDETPKCLVEVAGTPILFRTLSTLADGGLDAVTLVVGHLGEKIVEAVGDYWQGLKILYVWASDYDKTNNIVSLWEARESLDQDIVLLEGDVAFEAEVLRRLICAEGDAMVVSQYRTWHSGTIVSLDRDRQHVTELVLGADQDEAFDYSTAFKTANIYKFSRAFLAEQLIPALCRAVEAGNVQGYYEAVLRGPIAEGSVKFVAVDVSDLTWYEVDDHNDLDAANYRFATPTERLARIQSLHGGYWRYGFRDHSYLYNLYFPPAEMLGHFQRNMRNIVTSYPVAQDELARLVGNWTGASADQIAVANGASELIRLLGGSLASSITIPLPSFNEYENVIKRGGLNRFYLDPSTFELDVDAFADAAIQARSRAAIVVTPNNPTSLSVAVEDLARLAGRLLQHGITLVVDESFLEFSRRGLANSIQPFLDQYPNVILLKSMSKVFGISGLRLGYLICSDRSVVASVRAELPIWNVNGLGEEFLRVVGRYRKQFYESCEQVKQDRDEFYQMLLDVPGIQPVQPDANFILFKLKHGGITGPDLVKRLFQSHNTLIKDCIGKSMQEGERYLRVASRTPSENRELVEALRRLD